MTIDYLIIGQGLAGSLLAWELMQRGCSVVIIDNGQENASQVAAGLINPVTGMRLVKSADVDLLLPAAKQCYAQLAEVFLQAFYIEKPMLRLFRSDKELTHCLKRLADPEYQDYLGEVTLPDPTVNMLASSFGFLRQKQTGYLLTRPLLSCLKNFFIESRCYRLAAVDYRDIRLQPCLRWQDINLKQIIFCEGHHATRNPWFSWLPFQPVKGEILTLQHQSPLPDNILNFGGWLIPLDSRHIRVGATFDRENLNTKPTERGKNALLNALKTLPVDLAQATLINHQANIRPCTLDKQPFIGHHPQHPQLAIFNGFGAKGSLQVPWYSRHFVDALLNNSPLTSNIERHYATHFPG
jgi:glycine/D-amino acid oxidase-like deaminating enzyme